MIAGPAEHGAHPTGATPAAASGGAALDARIEVRRSTFRLDVAISAAPGEVLAVLGPNGAGKSTLLAALAGLLVPDGGAVRLAGRLLTGPGVFVPPDRRRVGLMGQDPLLFPHLTATQNIAFGPRSQGASRAAATAVARGWLERVGLADFGDRRPADMSGGQRQRIALARALAADPHLLLLDEPLGALDAVTAPGIRRMLRRHLREMHMTTLLVTHDVLDAAMLADRVVVLSDGAIIDAGTTAEVLAAPRSGFSATLAGLNLLTGTVRAAATAGETATLDGPGIAISGLAAEPLDPADRAAAVFPPSAVAVHLAPAGGSPRNTWPATVLSLQPGPSAIRVRARLAPDGGAHPAMPGPGGGPADGTPPAIADGTPPESGVIAADITPAAVTELGLEQGSAVFLAVKATEVRLHRR